MRSGGSRSDDGQTAAISLAREEAPERDALAALAVGLVLALGEALLERAERPARVGLELLERRSTVDVLRTDVAGLDDLLVDLVLFEPPER